jgi:hypothetical protein
MAGQPGEELTPVSLGAVFEAWHETLCNAWSAFEILVRQHRILLAMRLTAACVLLILGCYSSLLICKGLRSTRFFTASCSVSDDVSLNNTWKLPTPETRRPPHQARPWEVGTSFRLIVVGARSCNWGRLCMVQHERAMGWGKHRRPPKHGSSQRLAAAVISGARPQLGSDMMAQSRRPGGSVRQVSRTWDVCSRSAAHTSVGYSTSSRKAL